MHPLLALEYLKENFKEFILSKYPYLSGSPEQARLSEICGQQGEVFQEPVLQLDRPRVMHTLKQGEPSFFHPQMQKCLEKGFGTKQGKFDTPYTHQFDAWKRLSQKLPTVISTGTGSGKSESFILPLLDLVLKAKEKNAGKRKVRAIVIYPMNALLEDQHIRFCRFAYKLGLKIGVYNGSFRELKSAQSQTQDYKKPWKDKIFGEVVEDSVLFNLTEVVDPQNAGTIPDVLLTNYSMLQYMLLRSDDHLILNGAELEALALDEAHLYSGTLGLEMAALIARLREHIERSGGNTAQFVPMATSATLVRGGDERDIVAMSEFFCGLFSAAFPKDESWLIKDHFEDPIAPQSTLWSQFKPNKTLLRSVVETAKGDVPAAMNILQSTLREYLPLAKDLSEQLPWVLLRNEDATFNPVVGLAEAAERYAKACKKIAIENEATKVDMQTELFCLLSWLSLPRNAADEKSKPLLGLRVHAFTKSEPRIFREILLKDGKVTAGDLMSETEVQTKNQIVALPVAHCRSCAHEAYLAFGVDRGDRTYDLLPVDREPDAKDSVFALSLPHSFDETELTTGWKFQEIEIGIDVGGLLGQPVSNNASPKAGAKNAKQKGAGLERFVEDVSNKKRQSIALWRVTRKESKTNLEASDLSHCPSCLRSGAREQMVLNRGSPASDLSVHAQNILASAEEAKERRLLIFCDNRQDSSFLAGFMTDRHRRFRLRRAICQALAHSPAGLDFMSENEANVRPFAAQVLADLKKAGNDPSPKGQFLLRTLRTALTSDLFDFNSYAVGDFEGWMVDLIEKVNPASAVESAAEEVGEERPVEMNSKEGRFLIKMLSEAIFRDVALGAERQGALRTLGLVACWHKALHAATLPTKNFAIFLFLDLLEAQAWDEKPKGLEGQTKQYAKPTTIASLVHDISSRRSHFGKAFRENEARLAEELGLIEDGVAKDGDRIKVEAWVKKILAEYERLGLLRLHAGRKEHTVELKAEGLLLVRDVDEFKSSVKNVKCVVPKGSAHLCGLTTGMHKSDFFEGPTEPQVPKAWAKVYLEEFELGKDPFVRAHEHNGMLKPVQAMKAIQKFGTLELNTLVATPTLEMGIDLPDLPVVAHRSVPPDPSNYAQRAGRAGRDKRRALLFTHCGRGAHDMGYFQEPSAMVSGQIAPPGVPRENTWLLRRHVNAIVLQLMAAKGLNLKDWDALLERESYFNAVYENDSSQKIKRHQSTTSKQNWRRIFEECKPQAKEALDAFATFLTQGLWAKSALFESSKSNAELKRDLEGAFSMFLTTFQEGINEYKNLLELRTSKLEFLKKDVAENKAAGLRRRIVAELYSNLKNLLPIPFLQGAGILPNFDFPMEAVRFSGFKRNTAGSKKNAPEATVEYTRALASAMKEFAPGQRHYAAGHVFNVDRYTVVGQSKDKSLCNYGVCSAGCSNLTKLTEHTFKCSVCNSKLIGSTEGQTTALPPILRLYSVQGKTFEYIGDRKDEKDGSKLTSESLVIGDGNSVPKRWHHKKHKGLMLSVYESALGSDFGLDIMTVVGSKAQNADDGSSRKMAPLYRNSPDADDFSVSAHPADTESKSNDNAAEGLCIHPFLLGHKFNADALKIEVKMDEIALVKTQSASPELQFFETLRAVLVKAIRRELFLSSRSNQLSSFVFKKVVECGTEQRTFASALYLYDSVPGGSGILPLIRSYWPRILKRANNIVLSQEHPYKCCERACKRCISTYENQFVDKFLDKRCLRAESGGTQGNTTVFELFQGIFENAESSADWDFEKERLTTLDPDEPDFAVAETAFRKFLSEDFPVIQYCEQISLRNELDLEVTRPDFVLKNGDRTFHVFVDGYKYHGKASHFFGDLRKRNFIEFNSLGTTLTVPASRIIGKESNFEELRKKLTEVMKTYSALPPLEFEKRERFNPNLPEYDIPQYDEYDVFTSQVWKQPVAGNVFSVFKTIQVAGVLESTCQAVCLLDPPILESGFIEKTWWHLFWKEALDLQRMGVRPVFIVTKLAKQKAA